MVSTNNLKNGMTLIVEDKLMQVVDFQHVKPGKGGAFVRTKLKAVESGKVVERTFRAGEDLPQAIVQKKSLQFLYREGDDFVFMDSESYEQSNVTAAAVGDAASYIREGDTLEVLEHDGRIVGIELPAAVALEIEHTEPGVAGNTVSGATKLARLETGLEIQVPLFIEVGEKVKVDTRTAQYLSRA